MVITLPSGKQIDLKEILSFYYDISESEAQILMYLAKNGQKSAEDITKEINNLSLPMVIRTLRRLYERGLVIRTKDASSKPGKPKYVYKTVDRNELKQKIINDIRQTTDRIVELIEKEFGETI